MSSQPSDIHHLANLFTPMGETMSTPEVALPIYLIPLNVYIECGNKYKENLLHLSLGAPSSIIMNIVLYFSKENHF